MKWMGFVLGVSLLAVSVLRASSPLAIEAPAVLLAKSPLVIRAFVEPDPANRTMRITAESAQFYRSSDIPLDGSAAPRSTTVEYADLPAGAYEIHTVLLDGGGQPRASVMRRLDVRPDRY